VLAADASARRLALNMLGRGSQSSSHSVVTQ